MPTGEQTQKKRTFDVLRKPANYIRYRHSVAKLAGRHLRQMARVRSQNWARSCLGLRFDEAAGTAGLAGFKKN
jgi:hypothetical protein